MSEQGKTERRAEQPAGYSGDSAATAGPGETRVRSLTPENRDGRINPSSPTQSTEAPSTTLGEPDAPGAEGMGTLGHRGSEKQPRPGGSVSGGDPGRTANDKKKDIA